MYLSDPDTFNIDDVTFELNEAISGGAVSMASTEEVVGSFYGCRFEDNTASYGGALYLSSGEGNVSVQQSDFINNLAGERSSRTKATVRSLLLGGAFP